MPCAWPLNAFLSEYLQGRTFEHGPAVEQTNDQEINLSSCLMSYRLVFIYFALMFDAFGKLGEAVKMVVPVALRPVLPP